ncbi:hypothetical protein [Aeromicrobium sp.]|uniref:hypothetical protein n=1 Tax=Aeromicrobium sp. TaxID=1871063 RepID=UPI0019B224FE|nr:hypothetical protein [Aeromicrobium sp.]MBC7631899.1 hypothetical protein [Aeromicrobium sp.]
MYKSASQLSVAASQIRSAAATMNSIVADLQSANTWSGADIDRFVNDWDAQVTGPLYRAAGRLDVIEFTEPGK